MCGLEDNPIPPGQTQPWQGRPQGDLSVDLMGLTWPFGCSFTHQNKRFLEGDLAILNSLGSPTNVAAFCLPLSLLWASCSLLASLLCENGPFNATLCSATFFRQLQIHQETSSLVLGLLS